MTVCYADTEARATAHEYWPTAAFEAELNAVLPTVAHFEQAAAMVSEDDVAASTSCSADPDDHNDAIESYVDAGFDHAYVHQVGLLRLLRVGGVTVVRVSSDGAVYRLVGQTEFSTPRPKESYDRPR